ncbi:MAG: anion transporter [Deltaproteobacteria bacterium]|nr:anion transporter [Deltaproteobacteria bacterium]
MTYLVIASRQLQFLKLDRPAGATIGAVAMVVIGGLPMDDALHAIDLHVLILLFGVLLIAAYLTEAQFFKLAAYHVLTRAKNARSLMFGLIFVSGALSAFLVNDTVCVVLTPLVVAVVVEARLPALPYLIGLASATNVGGVISLAGNPQNMIIGAAAQGKLAFGTYMLVTLPVGVVCLAANAALLCWLFRKDLPPGPLVERHPPKPAVDKVLSAKGLGALVLFAGLAFAGVSLAGAAVVAASALMLAARSRVPREAFRHVDWPLLVFFAGLFVVVKGIEHAGVIADLFAHVAPLIDRGGFESNLAFIALVVIASNIVSNVPLVLVAVAWVPHMHDPTWGYIMLAVASTLAGNLTLFGSVANIIVMESAGPRGEIGFWRFLRYGAILTIVDLVLAFAILFGERALSFF